MIVTNKQNLTKTAPATFPSFSKLDVEYKETYVSISESDPLLPCDLSWGGLFIWLNYYYDLELSLVNNNILLRYSNIFTSKKSYSLCGTNDISSTVETIFSNKDVAIDELENISSTIAESLDKKRYLVQEDRDSFDYVLDSDQQAHLVGTLLGKQRRKIYKFMRNNSEDLVIRDIDITTQVGKEHIINSMHTWDNVYTLGGNDEPRIEGLAINRALVNADFIPLNCLGIYIDGKLEGFTLYQSRSQFSIIHHTKVSYSSPYIFDFAVYATISRLHTKGVKLINFEQDLGISGLREHKLGLRPVFMLKKYTVKPA